MANHVSGLSRRSREASGFVSRKRQADAFHISVIVFCVRHRLAHIHHARFVTLKAIGTQRSLLRHSSPSLFHVVRVIPRVKERRCVTVVCSLDHVMTLYERLPCGLFITERILHDDKPHCLPGVVVGSIHKEEVYVMPAPSFMRKSLKAVALSFTGG